MKGLRRLRDLAEAFLDFCGVMGEERERALAKVDAKAVKRSQQKATSGEPEGDDEAEELRAADEKDEPPVPCLRSCNAWPLPRSPSCVPECRPRAQL